MMFEFLFLDLDDTILDFHKAERIAISKTIRQFGVEPTEEVLNRYHEINKWHWEHLIPGHLSQLQLLPVPFVDHMVAAQDLLRGLHAEVPDGFADGDPLGLMKIQDGVIQVKE